MFHDIGKLTAWYLRALACGSVLVIIARALTYHEFLIDPTPLLLLGAAACLARRGRKMRLVVMWVSGLLALWCAALLVMMLFRDVRWPAAGILLAAPASLRMALPGIFPWTAAPVVLIAASAATTVANALPLVLLALPRARREFEPRPPGPYCPNCRYRLTGLTTHRCPECGRPFTLAELGITADDLAAPP